jgi:hypothetical protein
LAPADVPPGLGCQWLRRRITASRSAGAQGEEWRANARRRAEAAGGGGGRRRRAEAARDGRRTAARGRRMRAKADGAGEGVDRPDERLLEVVERVANLRHLRPEAWISRQGTRHLLHTVDNGGMIAVSKQKANLLEGKLSVFP